MFRGCSIAWMRLTMPLALDGGDHFAVECDALPAWASMDFPYPLLLWPRRSRTIVVRQDIFIVLLGLVLLRLRKGGNTRWMGSASRLTHDIPGYGEFRNQPRAWWREGGSDPAPASAHRMASRSIAPVRIRRPSDRCRRRRNVRSRSNRRGSGISGRRFG